MISNIRTSAQIFPVFYWCLVLVLIAAAVYSAAAIFLWSHLKTIVPQMRSQIFR